MEKSQTEKLEIVYVPISEIHPNEFNPKRLSAEAEKGLRKSIETFGPVDPLILNSASARKDILIGGHQRLSIYKKIGMRSVRTWTQKFAYQPCMINRTNIQAYEKASHSSRREGADHQPH
jgi:ParB-like chromosome segregation protein Spo0J